MALTAPPPVAIKEANTHLQALFEENQKLDKEIYDLREIIARKQEQEQRLLEQQEFMKQEYEKQLQEQRQILNKEHEGKLLEQQTLFEQEKQDLLFQVADLKNNKEVAADVTVLKEETVVNQVEEELPIQRLKASEQKQDTGVIERQENFKSEDISDTPAVDTNAELDDEVKVITEQPKTMEQQEMMVAEAVTEIDHQQEGAIQEHVVEKEGEVEKERMLPVDDDGKSQTNEELIKLQNIIQEQNGKIISLENKINQLVEESQESNQNVGEMAKKVQILKDIMKYKSAIKSVTECLEQAEKLNNNLLNKSDDNNNVKVFLDIETNV